MIKVILKKALILSLPVIAFSVFADGITKKEFLAKQCGDLSRTIASLVSSQQNNVCIDKLVIASTAIDKAGPFILAEDIQAAKQQLSNSIFSLQYAELTSCNQYIYISHSKYEANKIRKSL